MKSKSFFLLIILGTVAAWLGCSMVVVNFDPNHAGWLQFFAFYASLFLAFVGTIFLIVDWIKSKIFPRELVVLRVSASWRHAVLFALLLIGWGLLKSHNLAFWWVMLLVLLVLTMVEFFFMSLQRKHLYDRQT